METLSRLFRVVSGLEVGEFNTSFSPRTPPCPGLTGKARTHILPWTAPVRVLQPSITPYVRGRGVPVLRMTTRIPNG